MMKLTLTPQTNSRLEILCLGAHSDDIEIGLGGTILQWLATGKKLQFTWVIFSAARSEREKEARRSAELFLRGAVGYEVIVKGFRDGFYPYHGASVKDEFEALKKVVSPDLIFTHHRNDRHQDHRTISDLTWNTWRDHMILEYEVPKYDGDLGQPNLFVPFESDIAEKKSKLICELFQTQANKAWLTEDTFMGLMRIRGVECAQRFAEAFYVRKLLCNI